MRKIFIAANIVAASAVVFFLLERGTDRHPHVDAQGGPPTCQGCHCTVTATDVNFGLYDGLLRSAVNSTGNIEVSCSTQNVGDTISYDVELSKGHGNYSAREMTGPPQNALLTYNLYTSASYTVVWGDGHSGSSVVSDSYVFTVLCCEIRNYTMYGRIDAGQNAVPGAYADSLMVSVSY
ncbi:Csu type fimbrial protein [Kordiimonas marina]|uniref:Csu type fimbrial protein n=1 Tax=Kordiimonas marina TaxID=2872312 RepID=UPI001FF507D2|nr:spore coat U domain-containing protein [Kordiimonas marina]MCJ9430627.1 spore coat U domain-containing protein [Kordiimonas marina]